MKKLFYPSQCAREAERRARARSEGEREKEREERKRKWVRREEQLKSREAEETRAANWLVCVGG